jgi:hypothetical protein
MRSKPEIVIANLAKLSYNPVDFSTTNSRLALIVIFAWLAGRFTSWILNVSSSEKTYFIILENRFC